MMWLTLLRSPWTWVAAALLGMGAWGGVQTFRLHGCQDHLVAAKEENAALRERIAAQNAAVDRLKADSDARMADASRKLQEAAGATRKAVDEAARLKALAAKARQPERPRPLSCQPSGADRAVSTIREGLK